MKLLLCRRDHVLSFYFYLRDHSGALDFWVVKNVSRRILVGLQWWWSAYDEKGMRFGDTKPIPRNSTQTQWINFFWSGQVLGTLVWVSSRF